MCKVYQNGQPAVNYNSFTVKKGEVLGLLGPIGAGKTTMFDLINMGLRRTGGDVKLFNRDIDKFIPSKHGQRMGMVS